jgi:hypothetical protein
MIELYDPFTYETLMAGIVIRFEQQPLLPLTGQINIEGPGIYCLVYGGEYDLYSSISKTGRPIYAGRAVPSGSRVGDDGNINDRVLQRRIREHKRSIDQAQNLAVEDFTYRSLAVKPAWIDLAERAVIRHYRPLWNACLDGFGDHNPGRNRDSGERSWWDTLHPGRLWAASLQEIKVVEQARSRVLDFLSSEEPDNA